MRPDPPIDEIREVRHKISEECGHNTKALVDYYRKLDAEYRKAREEKRNSESKERK